MAVDALGLQVALYRADHQPRELIAANIPLSKNVQRSHTGQVSRCSAASQNWYATQCWVTLRWTDQDVLKD
jgi:hypothetical protein